MALVRHFLHTDSDDSHHNTRWYHVGLRFSVGIQYRFQSRWMTVNK